MSDLLIMDYINSLPQPLIFEFVGDKPGHGWEVNDIDVETGLLRINVMGKLDVKNIAEARRFIDMNGGLHDPETFYSDYAGEQNGE